MAGPEKISIDNETYDASLKLLKRSNSILASNSFSLPENSSFSQPLAKYRETMVKINDLVMLYKNLVEKQAVCLQEAYDEITTADSSYTGGYAGSSIPGATTMPTFPGANLGGIGNGSTPSTGTTKPPSVPGRSNIPNPFSTPTTKPSFPSSLNTEE